MADTGPFCERSTMAEKVMIALFQLVSVSVKSSSVHRLPMIKLVKKGYFAGIPFPTKKKKKK